MDSKRVSHVQAYIKLAVLTVIILPLEVFLYNQIFGGVGLSFEEKSAGLLWMLFFALVYRSFFRKIFLKK